MIDLDELERMCKEATPGPWSAKNLGRAMLFADADFVAALRNAAPQLIAIARQADALHAAIWQAVALLNRFPGISHEVYEAHGRLRTALSDYADAMQEQKR